MYTVSIPHIYNKGAFFFPAVQLYNRFGINTADSLIPLFIEFAVCYQLTSIYNLNANFPQKSQVAYDRSPVDNLPSLTTLP